MWTEDHDTVECVPVLRHSQIVTQKSGSLVAPTDAGPSKGTKSSKSKPSTPRGSDQGFHCISKSAKSLRASRGDSSSGDGTDGNDDDPSGDNKSNSSTSETSLGAGKSEISGMFIIMDEHGWKQKVVISYDLNILSYAPVGSEYEKRVFSFAEIPWMEVSIPESTFQGREFRPPQFRIAQTTIKISPSVDEVSETEISDEYDDTWEAKNQYPDSMAYAMSNNTITSEKSIGAKIQLSCNPGATIEGGVKCGSSAQMPPLAAGIDLKKSSIALTPRGGLKWRYVTLEESELFQHYICMGRHSGRISVSEHFPSSIEASISTVLEIDNQYRSYERIRGIQIHYRHLKVDLQTDVKWNAETYAQFPSLRCAGGHQLKLVHQFRGSAGSWVQPPPKRIFAGDIVTGLSFCDPSTLETL